MPDVVLTGFGFPQVNVIDTTSRTVVGTISTGAAAFFSPQAVAVGEVRRGEAGVGLYRVPARGARLVRGEAPYFRVREGDLAALVTALQSRETSPVWGVSALLGLALGLGALIGAQSAAPPWFP